MPKGLALGFIVLAALLACGTAATSIPTAQPTATLQPTPTLEPTATAVPTAAPTPSLPPSPTPTVTLVPTPTPTRTPTPTPPPRPTSTSATPPEAVAGIPVSVTLEPSEDNTIYDLGDGTRSNGAGEHIFAGNNRIGSSRRILIAFDVSGNIPAGATINSVSLTLNVSNTMAGPETVELHRVFADWGEGGSDGTAAHSAKWS